MKKSWIRFLTYILLVLFLIVGIPLLINQAYKSDTIIYITKWDAADVLSYYGTIVAAVIGIIGVYWTVYISNKNYRDDARNRILPFVVVNVLDVKLLDPFLEGFDGATYEDMGNDPVILDSLLGKNRNHLFFAIDGKSKIRVADSLSDNEIDRIKKQV